MAISKTAPRQRVILADPATSYVIGFTILAIVIYVGVFLPIFFDNQVRRNTHFKKPN